ncbi:MAG: FAD-dependent oxidoreductase, partial [Clostridia bacterium]|nr:FAD-dependent oxidoreductase [Deltaproteobacteria bacterium]
MSDNDFDLVTIGAGSGGTRASRLAAIKGARVAIAEEHRVGGTCVIRGCVPKKLFVYAANYPQTFKDAANYGWKAEATFDWHTLRDNVSREVDRLSAIYLRNLHNAGVEVITERAVITGPNSVRIGEREVSAQKILVASGGRPLLPTDVPGVELAITSDEAFGLKRLPRRALIVGGGYIAVEFATIFSGLGVETCMIYRGETVLLGFDDDVRVQVHADLERRGVRFATQTMVSKIEKVDDGLLVSLTGDRQMKTDLVMFAIGRTPHTKGLGLESAGIELTALGAVKVDAFSRTNVSSVYAIGDVTDRLNLTPVAIREAQAFYATAFEETPTAFDHADVPTAVFSQPPAAVVGLSEADARKKYSKIDVYRTLFRPMKHVLAGNEERMLM